MQEPVVCVQNGHLFLAGLHHMIVTVAHVAHVVDAIEELFVHLVEHVLAFGPHNLHGIGVEEQFTRWAYMLLSQRYGFRPRNLLL